MLRLLVAGYAGYLAYLYFKNHLDIWPWAFSFVAILHNPAVIISMSKDMHGLGNAMTAGPFILELYNLRVLENATNAADQKNGSGAKLLAKSTDRCGYARASLTAQEEPL
jgi:hypothetical protein